MNDSELTLSLNLKKKLPPYVRVNKKNWTWAKLFVVLREVKRIECRSFSGDRVGNIRLYGALYAQDFDGSAVSAETSIPKCGIRPILIEKNEVDRVTLYRLRFCFAQMTIASSRATRMAGR